MRLMAGGKGNVESKGAAAYKQGQAERAQIEEGMPGGGRRVNGSAMQCHCGSDNRVGRSLGADTGRERCCMNRQVNRNVGGNG